jgi:hypothetical protein
MAEIALDRDWPALASFESDKEATLVLMGTMALLLHSIAYPFSLLALYPPTSVARLTPY